MAHRITIQPGGQQCTAEPGMNILRAALDAGIRLPYGCRNGHCANCKGRILEGRVDHGYPDPGALSEEERARGYALFCCAWPLSDLVIAPRLIAAERVHEAKKLPARVARIERLAPEVVAVHLQLPAGERLEHAAGQYIEIIEAGGGRSPQALANAPRDADLLQLHVGRIPGDRFSERVFGELQERDVLRFEGPLGGFQLKPSSAKPVILLAEGTGFAPIKSMAEQLLQEGTGRAIRLYRSARDRAGLYLHELAQRWAAEHANFDYEPVVWAPGAEDAWDGRRGLAHAAVLADIPDLSACEVYVAGSPAMVEAAKRDFLVRGLPEEAFLADARSSPQAEPPG